MRRSVLIAMALTLLCSAPATAARPFGGEADVRAFLHGYLAKDLARDEKRPLAQVAFVDLDGDGLRDALAYVEWCGSGGCELFILRNTGHSYRVVTNVSISRPPIRVLQHRTKGWRDIAVWVSGGGILPGYEATLRFDGRRYPYNPSVPPAFKDGQRRTGEVMISDYGPKGHGRAL